MEDGAGRVDEGISRRLGRRTDATRDVGWLCKMLLLEMREDGRRGRLGRCVVDGWLVQGEEEVEKRVADDGGEESGKDGVLSVACARAQQPSVTEGRSMRTGKEVELESASDEDIRRVARDQAGGSVRRLSGIVIKSSWSTHAVLAIANWA